MLQPVDVKIAEAWKTLLKAEFEQPYFHRLVAFLRAEKTAGVTIYPPGSQIFEAFRLTSPEAVRVVLLGQDPYHGFGQAHGLCFSVPYGVELPPSLQNIFKEQHDDLGIIQPGHGNLTAWAEQGVLLLNATLTVRAGVAGSHQNQGWEPFTDAVIYHLNRMNRRIVFLLWGNYAQRKAARLDSQKHLLLMAAHPSPLSAYRGFFGCKHFSQTNAFLKAQGTPEINWQLPALT